MTADDRPLSGLRIGQLTAWASRANGGVFGVMVAHARTIAELGGEPVIFALEEPHAKADQGQFAPFEVHHYPVVGPAKIGYAPTMAAGLVAANLDLLHIHGVWMYPSRAGMLWARRTGRPYVISPHGMLDPWITGRGKAQKMIARLGYEHASWRAARLFHALTQREALDISTEAGPRAVSEVIPNASPAADPLPVDGAETRPNEFLYLGRIHPKKNVHLLVEAWKARQGALRAAEARLTIAGWGSDEDVAALKAQVAEVSDSVAFLGPIFGAEKEALFRRARFFALPSLSEGLPMVVLEAWAARTPVLMSTECNLPEGFAAGAAMDCGVTVQSIGAALVKAARMRQDDWSRMSVAARGLSAGEFSSDRIARRWADTYVGLIKAGA